VATTPQVTAEVNTSIDEARAAPQVRIYTGWMTRPSTDIDAATERVLMDIGVTVGVRAT
jgi:hypothetical protein